MAVKTFDAATLGELRRLLAASAGLPDDVALTGTILNDPPGVCSADFLGFYLDESGTVPRPGIFMEVAMVGDEDDDFPDEDEDVIEEDDFEEEDDFWDIVPEEDDEDEDDEDEDDEDDEDD